MFNGIIKNTGKISKIYKKSNNCFIEIFSKMKFTKNEIGSSISCSGACLTVEKCNKNLKKNGSGSIRRYFGSVLKNNKRITEKVNLSEDKLISYKLK